MRGCSIDAEDAEAGEPAGAAGSASHCDLGTDVLLNMSHDVRLADCTGRSDCDGESMDP